jgi:hypothetical protein
VENKMKVLGQTPKLGFSKIHFVCLKINNEDCIEKCPLVVYSPVPPLSGSFRLNGTIV